MELFGYQITKKVGAKEDKKEKEMIIMIKILWVLFAIVLKLATIGLGAYFLEKALDVFERMVDRHLGVVTV